MEYQWREHIRHRGRIERLLRRVWLWSRVVGRMDDGFRIGPILAWIIAGPVHETCACAKCAHPAQQVRR
jgi:hypothetical protein